MKKEAIIETSKRWVQEVVIGLNLCPFAKYPFDHNRVRFSVIRANHMSEWIKGIYSEAHLLNTKRKEEISNTLLIFPNGVEAFLDFLDLVEMAQITLEDQQLNQKIQLASFHPDYQFAGTTKEDVTNYTNRSPYPMLHLLRVEEVSAAISRHGNTEIIPENNKETLRQMGLDQARSLFTSFSTNR